MAFPVIGVDDVQQSYARLEKPSKYNGLRLRRKPPGENVN
jgi:hypothetical protein